MEHILAGLNDEQAEAVQAAHGPVVILAGAGTGKTTTITRRIAYQVATDAFAANQLLAVTFTVKAAREMGSRLRALGVDGVKANTFHAEALGQFRRFSPDQPEIIGHKGQILHSLAQRLPPPHKFTALRDLATEIEWAKNRRISAKDYPTKIGAHEPPIPVEFMHRIYVDYEKRKRASGSIDFEDLLDRTGTMLEGDPRALGIVRGRYAALTVDEYQDVNLLQQRLLDLWLGTRDDLCVVGDDYQSIFGFTGASPKYLLKFADRFERAHVVTLTENHRSTPEILDVANRLVPRLGGSKKRLRPTLAEGPSPLLKDFERGEDEVTWIAGECARLHKREGVAWEEMAVLFRLNGRSEDFEEAFARLKIPYQVRDGSFLNRAAARAFLARARNMPPTTPAAEAVSEIAKVLGHDPSGAYGSGEEATRQADLARLVVLAIGFDGDLVGYVEDLRARFAPDDTGRGVHLLTYHRSKGLEFDAVFLPRLEERELPFALSASEEEIAEERRLFYVGITRAKKFLAISYARRRDGERRTRPKPSMFISEIRPRSAGAATTAVAAPSVAPVRAARAIKSQSPLYEALREWRAKTSAEAGLPAYVVFHDKVLAEITATKPTSPADLRAISGVGALKMQRYGEDILKIVSEMNREPAASA